MPSQCNFPTLTIPKPPDILSLLLSLLPSPLPSFPALQLPAPPCPLDEPPKTP